MNSQNINSEELMETLPHRERLVMKLYFQGFSGREITEKINRIGFSLSLKTVFSIVRRNRELFFKAPIDKVVDEKANAKSLGQRKAGVTRGTHTRPKRSLGSGTTPNEYSESQKYHVGPKKRSSKSSTTSQLSSQPGWTDAVDLLARMQVLESRQGVQAAFDASPEDLGQAAVEQITKRNKGQSKKLQKTK